MALCKVTGTLYVPSGEPAASYVLYLTRLNNSVIADYNGSVVPEVVRVPVGRDGSVDFEILTGEYYGIARPCGSVDGFSFSFAVPDASTAAFEDCIDAIAPDPVPPQWLQRVEQAVADAEAAAAAAQEDANSLSGAVGIIEEITSGDSISTDGGVVLIGYRNDRAALVQFPDGLDFIPSDTLRGRVVGDIREAQETSGGVPLVGYENNRVAIMQKADGLDFIPSLDLIDRFPIQDRNPLSETELEINGVNGQSHSIGGPWDTVMTYARAMGDVNVGALQLDGTFRSDGAAITSSLGPGMFGYDLTKTATGISSAVPGSNQIGLPFSAFAFLNDHRADLNLPQCPSLTGAHGIGGIALSQMGPGSIVWDSFVYWNDQAMSQVAASGRKIRRGWHVFNHGGAGKTFPRGQYRAEWIALQKQTMAHFDSIGLPQPRYIITLTGGEANTANDTPGNWAVADDQLDLVEMGCAVAGTSDYWYPIYDNQVHWDAAATAIAGETLAWAMAEVEGGRHWSITRPKILSNSGSVLILSFESLREDEQLEVEDSSKYNGEGIDAYLGFQLEGVGASITSVDVTGCQVSISYIGTPTAIKYARQIQDVSGFAGNKYTAHRGLLRTTLRKPSKFIEGELLVRPIPSFTLPLGA